MKKTEITLDKALKLLDDFCPVKVIFNNCILYNDYDDNVPLGQDADGDLIYGEVYPPIKVIPERLYRYQEYFVTDIKIYIVQHHHCILDITGYYDPKAAEKGSKNGC